MKVWLVCEHPDGWGGVPNDLNDILTGVFVTREAAEECLKAYVDYFYGSEGRSLSVNGDVASDEYGHRMYQIVERQVGSVTPYPVPPAE